MFEMTEFDFKPSNPSIKDLYDRWIKKRLDLEPAFQRRKAWGLEKKCRLIESLILHIPIGVFYFYRETPDLISVIDGKQRLEAIFDFIENKYKLMRVTEKFKEHQGLYYRELPTKLQERILEYDSAHTLTCIDDDPNIKYELFERLNKGNLPLSNQELRNCVFRGAYNDLLIKLSKNEDFRYVVKHSKGLYTRMRDVELVGEFGAFYFLGYEEYKTSMKVFIDREMKERQHIAEEDAEEIKTAFERTCRILRDFLDRKVFRRFAFGENKENPNGEWEKRRNVPLYDILTWAFAKWNEEEIYANFDCIREAYLSLMGNKNFIKAITNEGGNTSSTDSVKTRFKMMENLMTRIVDYNGEGRWYSTDLKEELYEKNKICTFCEQEINDIDDAMIDNEPKYWTNKDTKTTLVKSQMRLIHRACNKFKFEKTTKMSKMKRRK